jgi:CBS domain-containing membrane protein
MLNALAILATAIVFNNLFHWRRYPAAFARKAAADTYAPIAHEDFVYALSELDSFVDVSEEELITIYRLATGHHERAGAGRASR